MTNIDISKMRNIFDKFDKNLDINTLREKLYSVSKSWAKQLPRKYNLSGLKFDKDINRYQIEHNNINYECLFLPSPVRKLYISLCGGGRLGKNYPVFLRWKYHNILNGNYICIDDPMYSEEINKSYSEKTNGLLWYYGTNDISYLQNMVPIIKRIMELLKVSPEDTVLFGSSGGGTAAIYLANILDGTTAFALNPQYELCSWKPQITKYFNDILGIDLTKKDIYGRNYIDITNKKSKFFLVENIASPVDYNQCTNFFQKKHIPMQYGISQYDNIITWIHHTDGISAHSSNPEKYGFYILDFLNEELKTGSDINSIKNLSLILNELLNEKYSYIKKIDEISQFRIKFIKILYEYIITIFPTIKKISNFEAQKFDMRINGIDDIYYRIYSYNQRMFIYFVGEDIEKYKDIFNSISIENATLHKNFKEIYLRKEFSEDNYKSIFADFINKTTCSILNLQKNNIKKYAICSPHKLSNFLRNEEEIQTGNRIIVIRKDGSREEVTSFPKLEIEFKGTCGLVELHESIKIKNKMKLFVGNKSYLHLEKQVSIESASLNLSAENTTMWVGERSWLRTLRCICNAEPGLEIIMGKDIVMSLDVLFRPTDGHTIIDLQSGLPINKPTFGIHIDDHVWIGQSVTILKDVNIPQDCIIGAHAVVSKKNFVQNSIIAGIPAKCIRTGINWDKKRIHEYLKSIPSEKVGIN